jgi:hypothetical protein
LYVRTVAGGTASSDLLTLVGWDRREQDVILALAPAG